MARVRIEIDQEDWVSPAGAHPALTVEIEASSPVLLEALARAVASACASVAVTVADLHERVVRLPEPPHAGDWAVEDGT